MKVLYVLLCCAVLCLNVLASSDEEDDKELVEMERIADLEDRKKLHTTNTFIKKHVKQKNVRGKITHFVCQNEVLMEELTYMFALPEKNFNEDPVIQHAMELELQREMLEGLDLTEVEVADLDPTNYEHFDFIHTCRMIGLFWSVKDPTSYITNAEVTPDDNTCVIHHGTTVVKSFQYDKASIVYVDNVTHMVQDQSFVLDLA